ncbi:hypothetical protein PPL_05780 [Heterostelium album PN500]|uniref:Glutathione S-transferase n=1 Tax=Heterostelium pallidum (strain ATCC 26659 / Pp 5 / PN500) TaxID=670386 RepID=D3BB48_HETP5|nr:hypothetical protein PPL_05780 [Heterostelium album PN500]EFA81785.1 hypothetical protein PPL_05780 [Heterostelium album PN500]|eukprot:XP_020433902.1 hypothetical protein PPL_05780 [Heterostelium album PN500]
MDTVESGKPNLYYFNTRGRAETIRLILAYVDIEYNDIRIDYPMNDTIRKTFTFGQVPYYEDSVVGGLSQSIAIEHYLANRYNLSGKSLKERALIESYAHATRDVVNPYYLVKFDDAAIRRYQTDVAPNYLLKFERLLSKKTTIYIVSDEITWADLSIFNLIDFFHQQKMSKAIEPFPNLNLFYQQISSIPSISQYLQSREKTRF